MPAKRLQDEPLAAVVNVRISAGEKAELKEDAATAGLSLSRYARRRLFGRRVTAQADEVVLRELRRLGGLVKHTHNSSDGAYNRETSEALQALRQYIDRLANDR